MTPKPNRPTKILLRLGLAVAVVLAVFVSWRPHEVVVTGQIEPAELRKVYVALGWGREQIRRKLWTNHGLRIAASAYSRDLRSNIIAVDVLDHDLVQVTIEMPDKWQTQSFMLERQRGEWCLAFSLASL